MQIIYPLKMLKVFTFGLTMTLGVTIGGYAYSAPSKAMTIEEIANYQGSDRETILLEAAKKENGLTLYHVYPALIKVGEAFTKKYNIKIKYWRAGSEAVLLRISNENKADRHEVDIVQNNSTEAEQAFRDNLGLEVRSPFQQDLIPEAVPKHHKWVGISMDIFSGAYNTQKVKSEDLPTKYEDLTLPKYKGLLGIEAEDEHWFGTLTELIGQDKVIKIFDQMASQNGVSVRKGHSLIGVMVSSGEIPIALDMYSWITEHSKAKGAPIEHFTLQPLIAQASTLMVMRKANNPNTALLFYDFLITDGQKILAENNFIPASKKIPLPSYVKSPIKFIDPSIAIDNRVKWTKLYESTVTKRLK